MEDLGDGEEKWKNPNQTKRTFAEDELEGVGQRHIVARHA